jgi:hypothetical protein
MSVEAAITIDGTKLSEAEDEGIKATFSDRYSHAVTTVQTLLDRTPPKRVQ